MIGEEEAVCIKEQDENNHKNSQKKKTKRQNFATRLQRKFKEGDSGKDQRGRLKIDAQMDGERAWRGESLSNLGRSGNSR